MATTQKTLASASYINSVAAIATPSTALNYTPAVEGVVFNGQGIPQIIPGIRITTPGVVTAGTPHDDTTIYYSPSV